MAKKKAKKAGAKTRAAAKPAAKAKKPAPKKPARKSTPAKKGKPAAKGKPAKSKKAAPSSKAKKKSPAKKAAPRKAAKTSSAAKSAKAGGNSQPRSVDETYTDAGYGDAVTKIATRRRSKPAKVSAATLEGYKETPSNGDPTASASPPPAPKKPREKAPVRTIELEAGDIFAEDFGEAADDDDKQPPPA